MTQRTKTVVLALALLLLIGAAFFACERAVYKRTGPAGEVVIRLGYRPKALADVTPVVIEQKGLRRDGLRIVLVPISSPADAMQKFDANEIDAIAGITMETLLKRIDQKDSADFRAYYVQTDVDGNGWVSIAGFANSLRDLAGKTVASLPTDQAQYLLRRILHSAGLADSDIKIVTYNPATPTQGLQSKEHFAIFGLEPAIAKARALGATELAAGPVSHYLFGGRPVALSASIVRSSFLAEHNNAVHKLVDIVGEAAGIAQKEPDTVRQYFTLEKYGALSQQESKLLYLPTMTKGDSTVRSATEQFVKDLVRDKLLVHEVSLDSFFAPLP